MVGDEMEKEYEDEDYMKKRGKKPSSARKPSATSASNCDDLEPTIIIEGIGERRPTACVPLYLLSSLTSRLSDKAPGVRARAAQSVHDALNSCLNPSLSNPALAPLAASASATSFTITNELRKRCQFDERAAVRKSAVQALAVALELAPPAMAEDVDVLEER